MKILIPLDGLPGAEAALPKAMELAKQSDGAKLCLVRAVAPVTRHDGFAAVPMAAINEAAEYLKSVAEQLQNEGADLIWRSVRYATAGAAIVDAAKTVKADLVVMASRGAEVTPGTLAEFVRQRTGVPIVLVPWSRRTIADAAFVHASA
jgi:nucleotide-binding universal stress UspA family protein